jgi:hypothetical protein
MSTKPKESKQTAAGALKPAVKPPKDKANKKGKRPTKTPKTALSEEKAAVLDHIERGFLDALEGRVLPESAWDAL